MLMYPTSRAEDLAKAAFTSGSISINPVDASEDAEPDFLIYRLYLICYEIVAQ